VKLIPRRILLRKREPRISTLLLFGDCNIKLSWNQYIRVVSSLLEDKEDDDDDNDCDHDFHNCDEDGDDSNDDCEVRIRYVEGTFNCSCPATRKIVHEILFVVMSEIGCAKVMLVDRPDGG